MTYKISKTGNLQKSPQIIITKLQKTIEIHNTSKKQKNPQKSNHFRGFLLHYFFSSAVDAVVVTQVSHSQRMQYFCSWGRKKAREVVLMLTAPSLHCRHRHPCRTSQVGFIYTLHKVESLESLELKIESSNDNFIAKGSKTFGC